MREIEIETETERSRARKLQLRRESELWRQESIHKRQRNAQIEALFSSDASCSRPTPPTDDGSMP